MTTPGNGIRGFLRPATNIVRSVIGTNGLASRITEIEAKVDALLKKLPQTPPSTPAETTQAAANPSLNAEARATATAGPRARKFISAALPGGKQYELNVEEDSPDAWHLGVTANALQGDGWQFLMNWIGKDDTFFDLGANIGVISVPAAMLAAQVTAFEMLGNNIAFLEQSIARNRLTNIRIVCGALSDRPGFVGIDGSSAWAMVAAEGLLQVPTVVLDDYVRLKNIPRVDIMKIDIEGSEYSALMGATWVLDRDHPDIMIESNSYTSGLSGRSYRDLLRLLTSHGYQLYRILPDGLAAWDDDMTQESLAPDYLATTKDLAAVTKRSDRPVRRMTDADQVQMILEAAKYQGAPRLHVLAVADRLSHAVRTDPQVARLIEEWQTMAGDPVLDVIKKGAA